ncbi:MAG: peptide deformylase [Patescibacteria group bacterium]|nr:peptide deformylase [Patescibacteria group bacterium]
MAILEIKKYPNPVLWKRCQEVQEVTEEIKKLGLDMLETMIVNQGIGLAASQIGVLKRIIVVNLIQKPQVFINPEITKKSRETIIGDEGCLSFPGLFLKIKRAKEVEIEALNENGKKISLKVEGLPARVFQHEIDHLDGILFINRLSFWQKLKLRGKLKEYEPR